MMIRMFLMTAEWEEMSSLSQPYSSMLQIVELIEIRWKQKKDKQENLERQKYRNKLSITCLSFTKKHFLKYRYFKSIYVS